MKIYRIIPKKFASDLSGTGAKLYGGRWNRIGVPLLYTSENLSLAVLENIVHVQNPAILPIFKALTIEIPNSYQEYSVEDLPNNWVSQNSFEALQILTDDFIKSGQYLAMKVPSATVEMEYNLLINPVHPLFKNISIIKQQDFSFDQRLFSR
jgi:RES domain-containing protein